jgi:hypothetical protein
LFINGSDLLAVIGRDKDATWRSLGTLCREQDWSKQRLLHELRNGLPTRTFPPGHAIDWHDPNVESSLNVEASEVTYVKGVLGGEGWIGLDTPTVGIEALPSSDAVPSPPAEAPKALPASAQWAIAATRKLRAEGKTEGITKKADLARLLEAESENAVRAGQIKRTLKASYLEDQLVPWGIWPLS